MESVSLGDVVGIGVGDGAAQRWHAAPIAYV